LAAPEQDDSHDGDIESANQKANRTWFFGLKAILQISHDFFRRNIRAKQLMFGTLRLSD
jgi:hypothetical protein